MIVSSLVRFFCFASCVLAASACASGSGSDSSRDSGLHDAGPPHDGGDAGPRDSGPPVDARIDMPIPDLGPDIPGAMCGAVTCMGFEYCSMGRCMPYPGCAPDGSCTEGTDICRSRHCVPRTADLDGDGVTAATDCDETDPTIHPGAVDICDGIDQDCNGAVDDAPAALLCAPGTGTCMMGHCACPPDHFDLDLLASNGCECAAMPGAGGAADCASAQDLGVVSDSGQMATVSGNALPLGREVWYRFHAVDTPDSSCDTFNVHVFFTSNPSSVFELTVFRGMCGAVECGDTGFAEYNFNTHLSMGSGTAAIGQCPCGTGIVGVNNCTDESNDFFVRVRRKAGSAVTCDGYVLEVSNGL